MSKVCPGHIVPVLLQNPLESGSKVQRLLLGTEQVSRAPSVIERQCLTHVCILDNTNTSWDNTFWCVPCHGLLYKQDMYMISELDTLSHHYMDSLTDVDRYRSHIQQNLSFGLRSQVKGPMSRIRQERSVYLKVTGKDYSRRMAKVIRERITVSRCFFLPFSTLAKPKQSHPWRPRGYQPGRRNIFGPS